MIKKVSGFQIIKTHLKSNWKLILFLFLIALAGSVLVFCYNKRKNIYSKQVEFLQLKHGCYSWKNILIKKN
ncbi:hypothetical protein CK556_02595 [Mesoplasma chauliocola]|uniref:Uncharacterized protein n=1 Tax=Mesoplasma chauliocola TaxID=216427 RepID=A0A249SNQ4_9MOLU|nr:hypothetical protein CK556_02595 [Mesoplasma chauliocola]